MTSYDTVSTPVASFEVGVAIQQLPLDGENHTAADRVPGYDEASGGGGWGRRWADRGSVVVEKGEDAVRAAAEAIAGQIGIAAQQIAMAIERQAPEQVRPGMLGLECVEVSFGVTLATGVQALFTAQATSSATVTITLSRSRPADGAAGSGN
jgi:hypothetical protein